MGIFCTVRAFMRFRGREALRDTYQKHGGVPVIVNQESDNWRVPRSNPSEQIGWWGVLPDRGWIMYCDRCGNELTLGGQYCTKCGKAILPGGAATSSATTGQGIGFTGDRKSTRLNSSH